MPLIVLAVGLALGITMWRYLRRRKRTVSNPGEVSQRL
jgi:hypothetical protein